MLPSCGHGWLVRLDTGGQKRLRPPSGYGGILSLQSSTTSHFDTGNYSGDSASSWPALFVSSISSAVVGATCTDSILFVADRVGSLCVHCSGIVLVSPGPYTVHSSLVRFAHTSFFLERSARSLTKSLWQLCVVQLSSTSLVGTGAPRNSVPHAATGVANVQSFTTCSERWRRRCLSLWTVVPVVQLGQVHCPDMRKTVACYLQRHFLVFWEFLSAVLRQRFRIFLNVRMQTPMGQTVRKNTHCELRVAVHRQAGRCRFCLPRDFRRHPSRRRPKVTDPW